MWCGWHTLVTGVTVVRHRHHCPCPGDRPATASAGNGLGVRAVGSAVNAGDSQSVLDSRSLAPRINHALRIHPDNGGGTGLRALARHSGCPVTVGMAGFEPAASCSQSRRANQAAPHPVGYRSLSCQARACARRARPTTRPAIQTRCLTGRGQHDHRTTRRAIPVLLAKRSPPPRGRSSMAEPQPSKLVMRVRFPSPAPSRLRKAADVTRRPAPAASRPAACMAPGERATR